IEQVKATPQQSAAAPKALSTKSDTEVKLYGFVRGDANYIIEGSSGDFSDVAKTNGQTNDKFVATAKTTRIGLDFKTNVEGAEIGGKLESDFAGTNDSFRVRDFKTNVEGAEIGGKLESDFAGTNDSLRVRDFKTNVEGAEIGGKLESDFAGTNDSFRVRQAYLTYENWLIGQTQSTFLSNHAPFMIDFST